MLKYDFSGFDGTMKTLTALSGIIVTFIEVGYMKTLFLELMGAV